MRKKKAVPPRPKHFIPLPMQKTKPVVQPPVREITISETELHAAKVLVAAFAGDTEQVAVARQGLYAVYMMVGQLVPKREKPQPPTEEEKLALAVVCSYRESVE